MPGVKFTSLLLFSMSGFYKMICIAYSAPSYLIMPVFNVNGRDISTHVAHSC